MYGDSDDNQDTWAAGYVPQLAAVTWVGRATPGPIRDALGRPIDGQGMPYEIWRTFLDRALAGQPPRPFPKPADLGDVDTGDAGPRTVNPQADRAEPERTKPTGRSAGPASPPGTAKAETPRTGNPSTAGPATKPSRPATKPAG
jgi:membrane peptidoglycan carboxypeptidase